jgi:broad specificity phosphatase PhoE
LEMGFDGVKEKHGLPTRLYLIRHGETAWSHSGRHTGRTDIPLTEQGEREAKKLEGRLNGVIFGGVFTSPLQRARRTCELAGLLRGAKIDPALAEWNYGDFEGMLPEEIRNERPGWNIFRDGCPHGETPEQVSDRADSVIQRTPKIGGNIAVFSHGHFGRVLAARWIGLLVTQAEHFLLDPASLSILVFGHPMRGAPAISMWNASANNTQVPR